MSRFLFMIKYMDGPHYSSIWSQSKHNSLQKWWPGGKNITEQSLG